MSGRRKNPNEGGGAGEEAWLLPYADMITLLLGLFIVLFALSSVDVAKFNNVSQAFSNTFRGSLLDNAGAITQGSTGVLSASATSANSQKAIINQQSMAAAHTAAKFDKEQQQLRSMAARMQGSLRGKVHVASDSRGLVIRVAGDSLFDSGKYQLKEPAISQLKAIANQLKQFGAPLEIEGHTDGQPFDGELGNYGLSTNRADAVVLLFMAQGIDPHSMLATGHASYDPLIPPTSADESIPKNRRVEIHVLAPGKSATLYTPEAQRAALTSPKATVMESAQHDQAIKTAAAMQSASGTAVSSHWGGTSKPAAGSSSGADLVAPIVNASQ
ncbi:MAG: flagellar motor protein MotB [Gaiellales bacterium]